MENQSINEKEVVDENENQDTENQDGEEEGEKKIGFKNQKTDKGEAEDASWKKVESIVTAAKDVYESGKAGFKDVIESMIATLEDLLASEDGNGGLGRLYGGPQMDIPVEPEAKPEEEAEQ